MSAMRIGVLVFLLILACTLTTSCRKEPVYHPPLPSSHPQTALAKAAPVADSSRPGTGTIIGDVGDVRTGEALCGAAVVIEGTDVGVATDKWGRFEMVSIGPGEFSLIASYIGYNDIRVIDTVAADCTVHLHIRLKATIVDFSRPLKPGASGKPF